MWNVLSKLLDLLLAGILERRRERKLLLREFEKLKTRVLYAGLVNDYPVELHKLRVFLIDNGLVNHPGIRAFFERWLTNPIVVMGTPAVNVFSNEELERLRAELNALQL